MDRFKKLLLEQFKLALEDGELGFTALYVKVEHEDVFIQFVIDFLSFGVCVSLDFSESSVKGKSIHGFANAAGLKLIIELRR